MFSLCLPSIWEPVANGTKQSAEETKFQAGELMEQERVSVEPRVNGKRRRRLRELGERKSRDSLRGHTEGNPFQF